MRELNEQEKEIIGKARSRGTLNPAINEDLLIQYVEVTENGEQELTLAILTSEDSVSSIVSIGYAKRNWRDQPNETIGKSLAFNRAIRGSDATQEVTETDEDEQADQWGV